MMAILKSRHGMLCVALTALSLLMTLALYRRLPPTVPVPVHWNIHGDIDAYGARWTLLLAGPGLMAALTLLLSALPGLSPPRYRIDSFRSTWLYLMVVLVGLLGYIHLVLLWAALSEYGGSDAVAIGRVLLGGCAVPLALVGNVMGKLRRNAWVGIRTPWTLADERVWYATHRLAGKSMVLAALACLAALPGGAPYPVCVALLVAGSLVPAAWSPVVAWRLARQRK